ncbi:MAG: thioredoxin TrxA [Nitrospinota bacterium]|jgi:thioredoxin 1|nr:thioredoxin TrxA [Nitrospinota bacterium]|tara:strand:- start:1036 stop:1362 length:327 start_codon:yes stop_codon:yes gene_type:complete
MAENMMDFTDQNFDSEVLSADKPTLVDFWAEWCVPCKMIAPTVEALADEYSGQLRVGKLNIDENPSTPTKFGIRGIPTLIIFKGGEVVAQVVGVRSKADLKAAIDKSL